MPRRYEPEDVEPIMAEISGDNDRAAINVGGSFREYALEKLIESRPRAPETDIERAARSSEHGILGTFSEKIWSAYFLKLIGPLTRRDLIWSAPSGMRCRTI